MDKVIKKLQHTCNFIPKKTMPFVKYLIFTPYNKGKTNRFSLIIQLNSIEKNYCLQINIEYNYCFPLNSHTADFKLLANQHYVFY